MEEELQHNLAEQIKLSKLLSRGFIFSIVWLGGVGSLIALVSGIRALVLIRRSNSRLAGSAMAWWCVVVGGLGVIVLPWYIYANGSFK